MAEEYVKTSAEELTAMAEYLRQNGDFEEGQKFIFPSSDYDENPTITYWIYDENETEPWIEKTASQAETLVEGGASILEVEERPETGESNTVYQVFTYQMGFKEAYQKYLDDFYDKIMYGTLKQEDLDGVIYSEPVYFFGTYWGNMYTPSFPNITEITIDRQILTHDRFNRLSQLKKVNVVGNSTDDIQIGRAAFGYCKNLEEINVQPTQLGNDCFSQCHKLKFGTEYLDLTKCIKYSNSCLAYSSLTILPIAANAQNVIIESHAFWNSNLEEIYLPDIPADLKNTNAFSDIPATFKFKVTSQAVKDAYLQATNWSSFDASKFEVITS